jgi:integrase/recombinase XerD
VLHGGDVVTLSRMLGHSSLDITQNYINILISDVSKRAEEINLLGYYGNNHKIKMK